MNDKGLTTFVAFTDEGRLRDVPVTLTMGGTIISGTIAPTNEFTEWMIAVAKSYVQALVPQVAPDVATRLLLETFSDSTGLDLLASNQPDPQPSPSTDAPQPSTEDDIDADRLMIIHLRDASIWTPGSLTPLRLSYWRGRLDYVSGWTLGELAVNSTTSTRSR